MCDGPDGCYRPGGGHYATCRWFVPDITPDDIDASDDTDDNGS